MTRGLAGQDEGEKEPAWGRWFRLVGARPTEGQTVMTGPDGKPLLVLSRVDKGRVGLLLSDQMWLWARGYDGGGPYLDLLRRLAHWLMKEPELEEEALRASARGRAVTVERQSVSGEPRDVFLVAPDGTKTKLDLAAVAPGLTRAKTTVERFGLYRAEDGAHVALVNVGPENPLEMRDVVSTTEKLRPLAEATGGSARRLSTTGADDADVPRIVALNPGPSYAGAATSASSAPGRANSSERDRRRSPRDSSALRRSSARSSRPGSRRPDGSGGAALNATDVRLAANRRRG